MESLPYKGHYETRGRTVYTVDPPMTDGVINPGDQVKIGDVLVTCYTTEHYMSASHPIIGVVV